MKYTSSKIITASLAAFVISGFALSASAQTSVSATAALRVRMSSTTRAENLQNRITKGVTMGTTEIDKRITSLNALITRVQSLKNVSDSDKTSLVASLNAEISTLTTLKTSIASDNSTTTLKTDVQSAIGGNRVYALVIPKIDILAATDRITTIVGMMNTVESKITTRLSETPSLSGNVSVQTALTDFNAKISDAGTQAVAATSEISGLVPDNGNKTILASNTATLKDARTKIQAAQKDLIAARQDIATLLQLLKNNKVTISASSTGIVH